MSKKLDRVVELVSRLTEARAEVASIEAELAELLGEGGGEAVADRRQLIAERATSSAKGTGRQRSEAYYQVVQLSKAGLDAPAIVEKSGLDKKAVRNHLYNARKSGDLPKAKGRA